MVHDINNVVIAGAGIMGSSIAQLFAAHEYNVILYDISEEALEKAAALFLLTRRQLWKRESWTRKKQPGSGGGLHFPAIRNAFKRLILS